MSILNSTPNLEDQRLGTFSREQQRTGDEEDHGGKVMMLKRSVYAESEQLENGCCFSEQ